MDQVDVAEGNWTSVYPGADHARDGARAMLDHIDVTVAYFDPRQVCVFANAAYASFAASIGQPRKHLIGAALRDLLGAGYESHHESIARAYARAAATVELEMTTRNGDVRRVAVTYTPHIVDGVLAGVFAQVVDVTALRLLERDLQATNAKVQDLATHDALTGLPNRVLLLDRLDLALAHAERNRQMVAVFSVDMDDFKKVSHTHGYAASDQVLIEIAARLKEALRGTDTVTRLSSDDFLLIAPEIESVAHVEIIAGRVMRMVGQPFNVGDASVVSAFGLGIALYPRDGATAESLIAAADRALGSARALGKNRYAFARPVTTK